jgi:hypothetical protein
LDSINIFVKDVYLRTFRTLIKERERETGFEMPYTVESYCVQLLAERVENNNLIPDPSFAERYLILFQSPKADEFRQFGDDCLFFTAILPEYGRRRGLSKRYYCDLGISSYHTCGDLAGERLYKQLGDCFYEIQQFLEDIIKNRPVESLFKLGL